MWYTIVSSGAGCAGDYPTDWPRGPWRSEDEALEALERWRVRRRRAIGHHWGTIAAAHHVRIVGPFKTRERARQVDISDYHHHVAV